MASRPVFDPGIWSVKVSWVTVGESAYAFVVYVGPVQPSMV